MIARGTAILIPFWCSEYFHMKHVNCLEIHSNQFLVSFCRESSFSINNAIQLSCLVQKMWINISTICHGLLAGLGKFTIILLPNHDIIIHIVWVFCESVDILLSLEWFKDTFCRCEWNLGNWVRIIRESDDKMCTEMERKLLVSSRKVLWRLKAHF